VLVGGWLLGAGRWLHGLLRQRLRRLLRHWLRRLLRRWLRRLLLHPRRAAALEENFGLSGAACRYLQVFAGGFLPNCLGPQALAPCPSC